MLVPGNVTFLEENNSKMEVEKPRFYSNSRYANLTLTEVLGDKAVVTLRDNIAQRLICDVIIILKRFHIMYYVPI